MPKALVRAEDGEPWLVRSIRALSEGGCESVTVVLGASAVEALPLVDRTGAIAVISENWKRGLSASLETGLTSMLGTHADAVAVTLVDLPDVDGPVVSRLLDPPPGPTTLRRATYVGRVGHPVVLGRSHWLGVLGDADEDRGARTYLGTQVVELVECGDLATGNDVDHR
jgi:molybdenum cofactor cytidylyltransferase/nicotine blue oxidoreductase